LYCASHIVLAKVQMKKVLALAGPVAVMIFLSNPALAAKNSAPAAPASGHGAVVFKNAPCFIPLPAPGTITTQSHAVVTPSGNTTLTCHSETARSGATFNSRLDEICFTPGGIVTSGHLVITRSGQINLICHIHAAPLGAATLPAGAASASSTHGNASAHRWQHGAVAGTGPAQVGRKLGHVKP
jgi:hypothetical protein